MANHQKERKRLQAAYGHLYSRYFAEAMPGSFGCFYCAEPADTIDHCPPLSWVEHRRPQDWKRDKIAFHTIVCCRDCNKVLGDRGLFTALSRTTLIRQKLETKYEREAALWSEEEIAQMSPRFQKSIRARSSLLRMLVERIRAAQWREMVEADAEQARSV